MASKTVTVSMVLALLTGSLSFGGIISGDITGTFNDVYHSSSFVFSNSIITGKGTNSLSLLVDRPGRVATTLDFTGQSVAAEAGTSFVMGTLTFYNGDWRCSLDYPEMYLTSVIFTAQSDSTGNPSFTVPIGLYTTPDNPDPVLNADFLYFVGHPELGSFRVYEYTSATIEIVGAFGSLDLVGFGEIIEGAQNAYWNPSVEAAPSFVPAPGAALLVSLGSGAVALCRRKRVL